MIGILILYDKIVSQFQKVELKLNTLKTKMISRGLLKINFNLENCFVKSISFKETIKYLYVNFKKEIVLNI